MAFYEVASLEGGELFSFKRTHKAWLILVTLLSFACVSWFSHGQAKRKRRNSQIAIVAVDGAAVYQHPNFDAKVIQYIRAGSKVLVSLKPRMGIGGFGAFYKVKLPNGTLGWMTDVDILPKFKSKDAKQPPTANPDYADAEDQMKNANREPVYFEKYIGPSLGIVQFSEKFDQKTLSSDTMTFGLRGVGPGLLFDGPPLDVSLAFSLEAPSYYSEFSSSDATGFFVIGDALFPFPFMASDNFSVTLGMGTMFSYTRFSVQVRSSDFDSQELRIGLAGSLSAMYRIDKIALKLDAKYYYEATDYMGYNLSVLFNIK